MGIVIVVLIIAAGVIGFYLVSHSGGTTTVHNPSVKAPSVDVMSWGEKLAAFIGTKSGGALVAAIIIGVLAVSLYRKLGKGQAIVLTVLAVVALVSFGVVVKH